jgi:hypothetical protein
MKCDIQNIIKQVEEEGPYVPTEDTLELRSKVKECMDANEGSFEVCPSLEIQDQIDELIHFIRVKTARYNDDLEIQRRIEKEIKSGINKLNNII